MAINRAYDEQKVVEAPLAMAMDVRNHPEREQTNYIKNLPVNSSGRNLRAILTFT